MAAFAPEHFEGWVGGLLEVVPIEHRADAATAMLGAVAAQLTEIVGRNEASAQLYALADLAATGKPPAGELA